MEAPPTQEPGGAGTTMGRPRRAGDGRGQAGLHRDTLPGRYWAGSLDLRGAGLPQAEPRACRQGPAPEDGRAGLGVQPPPGPGCVWTPRAVCALGCGACCGSHTRGAHGAGTPAGAGGERGRGGACAHTRTHTHARTPGRGGACRDVAVRQALLRCRGVGGGEAGGLVTLSGAQASRVEEGGE